MPPASISIQTYPCELADGDESILILIKYPEGFLQIRLQVVWAVPWQHQKMKSLLGEQKSPCMLTNDGNSYKENEWKSWIVNNDHMDELRMIIYSALVWVGDSKIKNFWQKIPFLFLINFFFLHILFQIIQDILTGNQFFLAKLELSLFRYSDSWSAKKGPVEPDA